MPHDSHSETERTPLLRNNSQPDATPRVQVSKSDLVWVLAALWSAVFLGALDGTIVATILNPVGSYFNKSHQASYLGTSYLLSVCCCSGVYGRLSDILGRKLTMLLALSLFGVGTAFCGLAPSMESLIAARAIAGLGGGGIMTVSSIAVTDLIPLKRRGLYQGLANILFGLGAGLGGPLGGWLNDAWGWRSAFLVQIPVLIFSATLIVLKVDIPLPPAVAAQSTREKLARIDYLGALTLMITVASLLLGVSLKTDEDLAWSNPIVVGLLVTAVLGGAAFAFVEARVAREPILPMSLLLQRTPAAVGLSNFFVSIHAFSMLYNVPLYFEAVRLSRSTDAGLHLLPNSVALSVGSVAAGWFMRHTGKYWSLTFASAVGCLIASSMVATWSDTTHWLHLWLDIVPSGLGGSALITSTLIALISSVDREHVAVATGLSYLFRTTGQVLGVSLSGALIQAVLLRSLRANITGPDAEDIIQRVRHSTAVIPTLDPISRAAAIAAYASALRAAFIAQVVVSVFALLSVMPIEEFPLAGSHEEQAEHDRQRRERTLGRSNDEGNHA
ncbi:MFS general substrate transporter [Exidia glandulosa HHB12029]|uniref:MFS general substrate transporter n=1 Tax=Exidia glandulosa HHB12029 TaxID=1314781 RepID=A0A165QP36_EXIGL|nr:MFS general substrate transporter [Exidia glandulosa HHB12029]